MRYSYILILLSFCFNFSYGQNEIETLEKKLKQNLSDSDKITTLIRLSREYQYVDNQKGRAYAEEALQLADTKDLMVSKIEAYQNIALFYTASGDFSTALRYDNLALQNSMAAKDSAHLAIDYNNIGNDYYDLGEYDEAYYYFTQSFRVARLLPDSFRMAIALHNVGRVFKELSQFERAISHLTLSKKISDLKGDTIGTAYYYDEMGDIALRNGEYDKALGFLQNALTMTRQHKEYVLEPSVLTKIARVYRNKKDYATALAFYDSTYQLHRRTNNQYGIAEVELGRGLVFMNQQKPDEALASINKSLSVAQKLNARILEIRGYLQLSTLMESKGDYKKSLNYFKQFKQLEDTLFSQDMQEKLLRDQLRFETEALRSETLAKDSQIAELNKLNDLRDDQLKRQEFARNILVVVMALSVILLVTVYRSGQRRRQINTLLLQHQEEMEKRSEELERLNQVKDKFFSIISHDLRSPINALAGILDLMSKEAIKADDFAELTKELRLRFNHTRTLLNNLLDWTLLQMDKLNLQAAKIDIHKIVEENISLLGSIQDKKIHLLNNVPLHAIGFADSNTVNLVIRNLMTNAIKFTMDGGTVEIDAKEKGFDWIISVKDNGIGMKPDVLKILFDKTAPYTTRGTANEKGTGLGLILCKEFVEKNGGKIWVESKEGEGSTFWFSLPKGN
ncbi:MAG: tetratricopeptide repeat protein [Cyclobacteriaceae bacterium]|nr:tetratricopeptide repeat protein [Cyclobacteriaceae bacterium]